MTITGEPRRIVSPDGLRAGHNASGADIAKNLFVRIVPAGTDNPTQISLPLAGGPVFGGTMQIIKNGQNGDVQTDQRATIVAGAGGVTVGMKLAATVAGAAVAAVSGDNIVGTAVTAAAATEIAEVELKDEGAMP